MKSTIRVRSLFVYFCLGAPLAASCAHESSPTFGSASAGKTSGGNKATAGTAAFSGTSPGAGTNGSNAFGGTNQGGTSTGGSVSDPEAGAPSEAGTTSGGTTSGGGTAGGGGSGSVPADVLMRASAVVYYRTSETAESTKKVQMKLNIVNQSSDPLPMSHVTIRYWATAEVAPTLHQYYVAMQLTAPDAEFVSAGDGSYALMTFGGGSITKGQDLNESEVQLELATNNGDFDQSDDFSWDPSAMSTPKPNPKITLYLDDQLIWGCEPSGKCFDDDHGAGGAGGQAAGGVGGSDGAGGDESAAGQGGILNGSGGAP